MEDLEPDGGVYLVDENSGALFTRREWGGDDSLMMNVVVGLAEVTGKDTDEIEPIQHKVDVDAIESLFQGDDLIGDVTGAVTFEHEGVQVRIGSSGNVEFRDPEQ